MSKLQQATMDAWVDRDQLREANYWSAWLGDINIWKEIETTIGNSRQDTGCLGDAYSTNIIKPFERSWLVAS